MSAQPQGRSLSGVIAFAFVVYATAESSSLDKARELVPPKPSATKGGETEDLGFWTKHMELLDSAWKEFGLRHNLHLNVTNTTVFDILTPEMRSALVKAINNPTESTKRGIVNLWQEAAPGIYVSNKLFNSQFLLSLRNSLHLLQGSHIPSRRPNGMNRYGLILAQENESSKFAYEPLGGLFQQALADINTHILQPLCLVLFGYFVRKRDISEVYAFTIRYSHGEDIKLGEHRDASAVTLNVNLNIHDTFQGSAVEFPAEKISVNFEPGTAIFHLGRLRHRTLPLLKGTRDNLVVWLHGRNGFVREAPYETSGEGSGENSAGNSGGNSREISGENSGNNFRNLWGENH
ncbi:hypothetical protein AAMO2058_000830300 [Amorphochlora amoebiformis]